MITFTANVRSASAISDDAITTSSVGIPIQLVLADEFMGLAKTLVFRAGSTTVDVVLVGDATEAVVPPDVLTTVGLWLGIGIYAADGDGNVVIPTVWASAGLIQHGTVPSGVDPSEPTPSWVAQVQSIASEASENAESALNKATAVEEAAARGDFDGADGTDGFSPIVTVTDITGGHRVSITDANGMHTFDVMNGINGTDGTDGTDGADGYSPTVSVTEIPGGHEVTITDVNGDHVFDVMDGTGGGGGAVDSVNGQTGTVVLDAADVGALPDSYTPPAEVAWFTYGTSTSAEIEAAYQAGKVCMAVNGSRTFILGVHGSATSHTFFSATYGTVYQIKCDNNSWSNNSRPIPAGSNDTPSPLGTASAGDGTTYARSNHVHAMPSASDVGAVAVAQGVAHAGEFVVVGSDGNITTVTMATWQGGSY